MANKMLIDATHPEETRVVVVRGNRVEEFDFESATKKQLRGNIYLAKVTRVEPSLQAAFVEYGGNRHGFLAFREIHPDYYQIPVADRQALLEAEERDRGRGERAPRAKAAAEAAAAAGPMARRRRAPTRTREQSDVSAAEAEPRERRRAPTTRTATTTAPRTTRIRSSPVGAEDALEEVPERRQPRIAPPVQDPGSHQAPAGPAGAGRQGRARQQGRGADHLPVARRPLFRADAQHRPRRRHLPQDHQRRRPQAPEGRSSHDLEVPEGMGVILRTAGASPHQGRDQARLRISDAPVGERPRADAAVHRPCPRLRGRLADQALHPRPLQQGHRRGPRRRRRRPTARPRTSCACSCRAMPRTCSPTRDDQPLFARYGVEGAARRDVLAAGDAASPAATSSSTRPRRWSRST